LSPFPDRRSIEIILKTSIDREQTRLK